jgi:CHAD domain-containing protein
MKMADNILLELQAEIPRDWSLHKESENARRFCVLDNYDCSLLSSGTALLEFRGKQGKIELFPEEIEEKLDAALPEIFFRPAALPPGKLRTITERTVGEWRLGSRAQGIETVERYRLENEDRKGVARIFFRTFQCEDGTPITAVKVQPYRGYDDEVTEVRSRFEAMHPIAVVPPVFYRSLPDSVRDGSKPIPSVQPNEGAREAVVNLAQYILDRVRHYEPGVIEDSDPEILHQYRVALRRMRSLVALLKTVFVQTERETLRTHLKLAMKGTGRLRDLDVQIAEVAAYSESLPDMLRPGIDGLLLRLRKEREMEFNAARKSLVAASFKERFSPVFEILENPAEPAAGTIAGLLTISIQRRYRRITREIKGFGKDVRPEQLHALRISCKKLRYLLEFFPQILRPEPVKPLLKSLKKLQTVLGRYNDLSVLETFLADQAKRYTEDGVESMAIGAVIMKTHESRNQLAEKSIRTAHGFCSKVHKRFVRDAVKGEKA